MQSKATPTYVLAGSLLLLGTLVLLRPAQAQETPIVEPSPATQWEYRVIIPSQEGPDLHEERRGVFEKQLNELGADGWEAVESPYLKGVRYQVTVLKRPKRQ
jgi:hypothetical protein